MKTEEQIKNKCRQIGAVLSGISSKLNQTTAPDEKAKLEAVQDFLKGNLMALEWVTIEGNITANQVDKVLTKFQTTLMEETL